MPLAYFEGTRLDSRYKSTEGGCLELVYGILKLGDAGKPRGPVEGSTPSPLTWFSDAHVPQRGSRHPQLLLKPDLSARR